MGTCFPEQDDMITGRLDELSERARARRILKRQLSNVVYRRMIHDLEARNGRLERAA